MESFRIWNDKNEKFELLESIERGVDYFRDHNIEIFITNNDGDNSTGNNGQTL